MTSSGSKTHSRFAPSAAKRWIACPGSVELEARNQTDDSSAAARWGSAAHQLAEMRLKKVATAPGLTNAIGKTIRQVAPRLGPENDFLDVEIDEEMLWVVQEYVIFVESLLPKGWSTLNENCMIEGKVHTAIDPNIYGTVDFGLSNWPLTLHIVDLKSGAGLQVEAVDNPQLAIYALGAMEHFGTDFESVKMWIFQPRGEGDAVRSWEMTTREFINEWYPKIEDAHKRVIQEPDTYTAGDHCKWCKGAIVCPKIKGNYSTLAKRANTSLDPPVDPKVLSKVLRSEVLLLEYLNQCKSRAFELLNRGTPVPGFKLVQTWGREKWANEGEVETWLSEKEFERCAQVKLRTPKQVRKVLGKSYPEELDRLTVTPNNGAKLVPETDKRAAILPAAEVFK